MPECIVCKKYYHAGTTCPRCDSDNGPWITWQKSEPVEREGIWGLLYFTEPHCHMPFLITATTLAFGLMGIAGMWMGINLAIRLLAVVATVVVCLIAIQGVYASRHELREEYLLAQVRTASSNKILSRIPKIRLSIQLKTILIPLITIGLVLFLGYVLVRFELVWKLAVWLFREPRLEAPPPPIPGDLQERVEGALPLVLLFGYISLCPALVLSSSLMLAEQYAKRMNTVLPHPIFLQGDLLARVVQQEVERHLCQPRHLPPVRSSSNSSGEQPQEQKGSKDSGRWRWETLERTEDGGIKLIAEAECEDSPVHEGIMGHRTKYPEFVSYTVRADRWGRVVSITRGERSSQYNAMIQ